MNLVSFFIITETLNNNPCLCQDQYCTEIITWVNNELDEVNVETWWCCWCYLDVILKTETLGRTVSEWMICLLNISLINKQWVWERKMYLGRWEGWMNGVVTPCAWSSWMEWLCVKLWFKLCLMSAFYKSWYAENHNDRMFYQEILISAKYSFLAIEYFAVLS